MKKGFFIALILLMSVFVFSKTKLVFWEFMMKDDTAKVVIDEFERENPDIEVDYVQLSWATGFDKIVTAFAANSAPDILELGNTWVANFANEGVIDDLSFLKDDFSNIIGWKSAEFDGKYYGVPWLLGTRAMYYNVDLFIKSGLDPENPPQTWDELLNAVKKIDALGEDIYGFGMGVGEPQTPWQEWFLPAVWGNEGNILSEDLNTSLMTSQSVKEAAYMYQELSKYSLKSKSADLMMAFGEGKIGLWIAAGGNINKLNSTYPDTNYFVTFLPKPSQNKGFHASFAGGEILTIPSSSKNKEAAKKFIEFLVRPEITMKITKRVPTIFPSNVLAESDPWFDDHILESIFFEQNATAVPVPPHPKWVDIQFELSEAIEEIVMEYSDVDKTLEKYNKRIQTILDKNKQ